MKTSARILIVDDDPDVLRATARLLEKAGYETLGAGTGEDGLRMAREHRPDLVLLDVVLREESGVEVCRRMKEDAGPSSPFVLLMSHIRTSSDAQAEGLEAHADGYIARPVSNRELVARVEAMLRVRQAEESLLRSRERYRELVENLNDMIFSADADGMVTYVNPAVKAIFGYAPEEVVGRPYQQFIHPEDRGVLGHAFEDVKTGRLYPSEYRAKTRTGETRWVRTSSRPILEGGRVAGIQGVLTDITEQKRAEEKLEAYRRELEERVEARTRDLTEARDALVKKEKLATLGRLAGGVGHELRNPLGAIRNATYFLNMALEQPSREVKEALTILERETMRSERTIASLFDHADPGKPAIVPGIDLHAILRRTLADSRIPASVVIDDRLDASLSPIDADPHQLEQVFGNLLRNAVQAMHEGGTLTVRSGTLKDGRVEVAVTDTGVGIPEDRLDKIFEPLFTTKAKGIGLGLALCKSHMEAHGGTIEVESEEGRGTTFRVILPVREA